MENFEKEYFIAKEAELWNKLNEYIEVFGELDNNTKLIRAKWATYYRICKRFIPEYRNTGTLGS